MKKWVIWGVVGCLLAAPVMASDAAKEEGKAAFYANITAIEPIMEAFSAATGVKGEYTRISTSKFLATVMTEFQAGKLMADVVQAPLPVLEMLKNQGVLAPYSSPAAADYPEWTRKDDHIQIFGIEYVALIYNKELVKAEDVPRRYEDLADPKWKDKIVMANPASHATTISWLVGLKENIFASEADWRAFLKGLAANKPMFVASFGPTPGAGGKRGKMDCDLHAQVHHHQGAGTPGLGPGGAAAAGLSQGHRPDRQGAAPQCGQAVYRFLAVRGGHGQTGHRCGRIRAGAGGLSTHRRHGHRPGDGHPGTLG